MIETGQSCDKAMSPFLRSLETAECDDMICKTKEDSRRLILSLDFGILLMHFTAPCWQGAHGNVFSQFKPRGFGRGLPSAQMQRMLIILMDKAPEDSA